MIAGVPTRRRLVAAASCNYTLWEKLTRFPERPELGLCNNLAEISMRTVRSDERIGYGSETSRGTEDRGDSLSGEVVGGCSCPSTTTGPARGSDGFAYLNSLSAKPTRSRRVGLSSLGRNSTDQTLISDLFLFRRSRFSNLLHHLYGNLLEMCFRPSHGKLLLPVTPQH